MQSTSEKNAVSETVIIKKYANRRLYNTETSVYVTLDDLFQMIRDDQDFTVQDAKTGQDITRQTLTQIILEQENKGSELLSADFLRDVIRFYDDGMREVLQRYLTASMQSFLQNQEKMRSFVGKTMQEFSAPMSTLEGITRQNMAMFERAFNMFTPFSGFFNHSNGEEPGEDKKRRK